MFSIITEYGRWFGERESRECHQGSNLLASQGCEEIFFFLSLIHWLGILWMLVLSWELCLCNWEPLKCQIKSDSIAWWRSREQRNSRTCAHGVRTCQLNNPSGAGSNLASGRDVASAENPAGDNDKAASRAKVFSVRRMTTALTGCRLWKQDP